MKSKGFLLHAFGSKELDYGKLAICCALSIKSNLKNNNVTVLIDKETKKWIYSKFSKTIINKSFDQIIIPDEKFRGGKRKHFDSPWVTFQAEFNNQPRVLSYKYSPYDETIVLDTDYLVMNNHFDSVWNNKNDILINRDAIDLKGDLFGSIEEQKLSKFGVPMYWATIVYFKKSEFAETFFNLVNYVREEYNFFQFIYGFRKGFYRNDFSFSVAVHIMNGYITQNISSFPESSILTSYQKDGIAKFKDSNEIIFFAHKVDETWRDTLVNIKNRSVHIMNKKELLRISDKYIDSCLEKI